MKVWHERYTVINLYCLQRNLKMEQKSLIDVFEYWSAKLLDMIDSTCTNESTEEQATTVNSEINLKLDLNQWKGYGEICTKYWNKTNKSLTPLRELYNYYIRKTIWTAFSYCIYKRIQLRS